MPSDVVQVSSASCLAGQDVARRPHAGTDPSPFYILIVRDPHPLAIDQARPYHRSGLVRMPPLAPPIAIPAALPRPCFVDHDPEEIWQIVSSQSGRAETAAVSSSESPLSAQQPAETTLS